MECEIFRHYRSHNYLIIFKINFKIFNNYNGLKVCLIMAIINLYIWDNIVNEDISLVIHCFVRMYRRDDASCS